MMMMMMKMMKMMVIMIDVVLEMIMVMMMTMTTFLLKSLGLLYQQVDFFPFPPPPLRTGLPG